MKKWLKLIPKVLLVTVLFFASFSFCSHQVLAAEENHHETQAPTHQHQNSSDHCNDQSCLHPNTSVSKPLSVSSELKLPTIIFPAQFILSLNPEEIFRPPDSIEQSSLTKPPTLQIMRC